MSPEDFRAQLQYDLDWRKRELSLLTNQLGQIPETDKEIYCKALIIMLYSHFEGFCRVAFLTYLKQINDERMARSQANEYIIASSLLDIFHDIKYPKNVNKNCCDIFNSSSIEAKFSKFFIYTELIRNLDEILQQEINIPEKISANIIDTESNLSPKVISRILYRLGLPYDEFDKYKGTICNLLRRRNGYAHGDNVAGIKENEYRKLENEVFRIISDLMMLLTDAAERKSYLKNATPIPVRPS
ncbi:Uncharacterised protein [uncultured archaeon]|nr:Uncharacterised protein [uncultured archaeon]